jgi:hypothetical protein
MKDSKKNAKAVKKPPMKYWLVELTSTDGDVRSFYVKAITQFDAYQKADNYSYWMEIPKLKDKLKFRLMP